MNDYERLKELAENATPGPWITGDDSPHGGTFFGTVVDPEDPSEPGILLGDASIQDAEFIAAANPDAILNLLEDLRLTRAELVAEKHKCLELRQGRGRASC